MDYLQDRDGQERAHHPTAAGVSASPMRMANEADMAGTAIFLASTAGAYLTGAVMPVDGGMATTR